MKAVLIAIGKTDDKYIEQGFKMFEKRIEKYMPFEFVVIPDIKNSKNLTFVQQKEREGELILKKIQPADYVVLLDELGKTYTSVKWANWLNSVFTGSYKRIVFVIGGPYGFSEKVYLQASSKISLSLMTFSHQMVRLIFIEQFYRAHTILNGEPYHHQ